MSAPGERTAGRDRLGFGVKTSGRKGRGEGFLAAASEPAAPGVTHPPGPRIGSVPGSLRRFTGGIRKFVRYARLYGTGRAWTKVMGRTRLGRVCVGSGHGVSQDVALVGCGQFAFSTICFYLERFRGRCLASCYDTDRSKAESLARYYGVGRVASAYADVLDAVPRVIYIASNHASHTEYAVAALARGINVYVEKPISVSEAQFRSLRRAVAGSGASLYAGYNRPFSVAVRLVARHLAGRMAPLSLSCFVCGHRIPEDHWYRNLEEGTRVCGNLGHWLDLAVHLFAVRGRIPRVFHIAVASADAEIPDDNLVVTLTTEMQDVVTLMLTSRSEPFEGINETVGIQCGDVTAKIDDFRTLTLWKGADVVRRRYRPKDVGHARAVMQPFTGLGTRWGEVEVSTGLMLKVARMVEGGISQATWHQTGMGHGEASDPRVGGRAAAGDVRFPGSGPGER